MKHRLERVREILRRELSDFLTREQDFGGVLVTIRDVDITADLRNAHVYVSILGSEAQANAALAKLAAHRRLFQHYLSKRVVLKYTPHLHFKRDESIARGARVLELLDTLEISDEE